MSESAENAADWDAMARLREGDDDALTELMDRWGPRVLAFLARLLPHSADAADAAQEVFVAVYRARDQYQPRAPFSTWLFGIALNQARRRQRWRLRRAESSWPEAELPAAAPSPGEQAQRAERAEAVRQAVAALPGDLREALILHEYEGLTAAETAAVVGCGVKAAESRLHRARALLRTRLQRWLHD
jgi:RNA polymerase sigma-70 factor (ECF subfamily)